MSTTEHTHCTPALDTMWRIHRPRPKVIDEWCITDEWYTTLGRAQDAARPTDTIEPPLTGPPHAVCTRCHTPA